MADSVIKSGDKAVAMRLVLGQAISAPKSVPRTNAIRVDTISRPIVHGAERAIISRAVCG